MEGPTLGIYNEPAKEYMNNEHSQWVFECQYIHVKASPHSCWCRSISRVCFAEQRTTFTWLATWLRFPLLHFCAKDIDILDSLVRANVPPTLHLLRIIMIAVLRENTFLLHGSWWEVQLRYYEWTWQQTFAVTWLHRHYILRGSYITSTLGEWILIWNYSAPRLTCRVASEAVLAVLQCGA